MATSGLGCRIMHSSQSWQGTERCSLKGSYCNNKGDLGPPQYTLLGTAQPGPPEQGLQIPGTFLPEVRKERSGEGRAWFSERM